MCVLRKLIDKYKNIPLPARASFWFLICGILQNGLQVITLPIFTRLLTIEQYGLSSTYFAWNDLVVVICTLRLSYGVFSNGLLKYEDKKDYFEAAIMGLTTTVSAIMLILFLIFHQAVQSLFDMSFILCFTLFACQICSPAMLFWTVRNKFEYQYQKFTIVTIVLSVGTTLLNLVAVLYFDYDHGIVKILSYQIVWTAIYLVFYIRIFYHGKTFYDGEIWKYALKFNLPLIPYFLSTIVLDKADRIMIGEFCGQEMVALYSVSYNLGRLMVLLTSAVDNTFTPWAYQKMKEKNYGNIKNVSLTIMIGFLGAATCFMLFAPELIMIFADSKYSIAVYVIPPVVGSYFFTMLYNLVSKVEFYLEKTKMVAIITVSAAVLNIVLNYIAIPRFGYVSAGYTTLISNIVMAIFHMIYSRYLSRNVMRYVKTFYWKHLLGLSAGMIVITVLVSLFYDKLLFRYCIIFTGFIIIIMNRQKFVIMFRMMKDK